MRILKKLNFNNFNNNKNAFKIAVDFLGNLFCAYAIIIALALIFFSSVTIECEVFGSSMQPTLNQNVSNHDYVYVNSCDDKYTYGDIVVVDVDSEYIIKRVAGLSGDRIAIVLDDGIYKLSRNDEIIEENYIKISNNVTTPTYTRNGMDETFAHMEILKSSKPELFNEQGQLVVPENEIFVLGDNRAVSQDSSFYGPFKLSTVLGKVELIRYAGTSSYSFYYNYILKGQFFITFANIF